MSTLTITIIALAPITLLAVGLVPADMANRRPAAMLGAARVASFLSFIAALLSAAAYFVADTTAPARGLALGAAGVGFTVYYDALYISESETGEESK